MDRHLSRFVTVLAVSLGLQVSVADADVKWFRDLDAASKVAAEVDKPLLVKVGATWCGACVRMDRTTFASSSVKARLEAGFVAVNVDADRFPNVVRQFGVGSFPTTFVLSPDRSVIKRMPGLRSASQLMSTLDAVRPFKRKPAEGKAAVAENKAAAVPLGFEGYCLVSLLDERDFRKGLSSYSITHKGVSLRFRSKDFRDRFLEAPEKYWPANDGKSPVALEEGEAKTGEARLAMIFRKRLYFFLNTQEQAAFRQTPSQYADPTQTAMN